MLHHDQRTSRIFTEKPLIAFRKDQSLRNMLVKSTLKRQGLAGAERCRRSRCASCTHVTRVENIIGPKSTYHIKDHFTCTSSNLVYAIICKRCDKLYTGETGRRLADRIRQHIQSIEGKQAATSVSEHFNASDHKGTHDIQVTGLVQLHGDTEHRRYMEQRLVFNMGTLIPSGMNVRFSFL
jgi:hypothetical protein